MRLPSRDSLLRWGKTLAFAALVALAVRSLVRSSSGPKADQAAPDFNLAEAQSAARVSLQGLRGTPVLLEAVTSWCGACERSAPALRAAAEAPRKNPVRFISVLLDSNPESANQLKAKWGITNELLVDDGSFARAYNISMLPTFILIDAQGQVRLVSSGSADRDDIEGWLAQADFGAAP